MDVMKEEKVILFKSIRTEVKHIKIQTEVEHVMYNNYTSVM